MSEETPTYPQPLEVRREARTRQHLAIPKKPFESPQEYEARQRSLKGQLRKRRLSDSVKQPDLVEDEVVSKKRSLKPWELGLAGLGMAGAVGAGCASSPAAIVIPEVEASQFSEPYEILITEKPEIEKHEEEITPSLEQKVNEWLFLSPPSSSGKVHIFSSAKNLEPTEDYSVEDRYGWGGARGYKDPFTGEWKSFQQVEVDGRSYVQIIPPFDRLTTLGPMNFAIGKQEEAYQEGQSWVFNPYNMGKIVIKVNGETLISEELGDILTGKAFPELKDMGLTANHNDKGYGEGGGFSLYIPVTAKNVEVLLENPEWFDCNVYFSEKGKGDSIKEVKELLEGKTDVNIELAKQIRTHPELKVDLVGKKESFSFSETTEGKIVEAKDNQLVQGLRFTLSEDDLGKFLTENKLVISYAGGKSTEVDLSDLFGFVKDYPEPDTNTSFALSLNLSSKT